MAVFFGRNNSKSRKRMSVHEEALSMINLRKEISENEMFFPDEFNVDGEKYSVFAGFGDNSKDAYLTDGAISENTIIDQNTTSFEVDGKDPTLEQLQNIAMIARIGAALNESLTLGGGEEFVEIGRGNYHAEFGPSDRIEKIRETAILIFSDLKKDVISEKDLSSFIDSAMSKKSSRPATTVTSSGAEQVFSQGLDLSK